MMPTFTMESLLDGDKFEALAHDLGLVYTITHGIATRLPSLRQHTGGFSMLTHNSDGCILPMGTVPRSYDFVWENIPDNLVHWFAQNVSIHDERLTPIPIGLERVRWHPELRKPETILALPRVPGESKRLLYLNLNTETNPSRGALYHKFSGCHWCTVEHGRNGINFPHYARQLSMHKFILCPDGNGTDTHRVWETLYSGAYPVVQRHCHTMSFAKQLPLLITDDWSELTQDYLERKYMEFVGRDWNWGALSIRYWHNLIEATI